MSVGMGMRATVPRAFRERSGIADLTDRQICRFRRCPTGDTPPTSTTCAARSRSSGIGETAYTKASGRTAREIGIEAAERAIADAGLEPSDIDGLTWSGAFPDFDVDVFREHFGTTHEMWTSPWGGGMAWAATAPVPRGPGDP